MMMLTLKVIKMTWLVIVLRVTKSTHVETTRNVYDVFCVLFLLITTQFEV